MHFRFRAFPVADSRLWNSLPRDVTPSDIQVTETKTKN